MPAWLKRSLLNLRRRPFRTGLVSMFLALVIGLFTVMAVINRFSAERFAELEGALESSIDVRPIGSLGLGGRRSRPLAFGLEGEIRKLYANVQVDPYLISREFKGDRTVFYVGVRPGSPLRPVGDPESMSERLAAGRVFRADEADKLVAVLGLEAARRQGIDPSTLNHPVIVTIRDKTWRVIGLFDGGNGFVNGQVFLPFESMRRRFNAAGLSRIVVRASSAAEAEKTADALRIKLAGQADVVTNRPAVKIAQRFLAGISGATRTGALLFLIAGALVVIGAMVLAFRDQQREIGVEKALGASNSVIAVRLLAESVFLTTLGGMGGLAVSWLGLAIYARSWTSIKFGLIRTPLPPLTVAVILLTCLLLGAVGSLYPILRSRRLNPAVILREE
jgi:putative ABC transport system permease protein